MKYLDLLRSRLEAREAERADAAAAVEALLAPIEQESRDALTDEEAATFSAAVKEARAKIAKIDEAIDEDKAAIADMEAVAARQAAATLAPIHQPAIVERNPFDLDSLDELRSMDPARRDREAVARAKTGVERCNLFAADLHREGVTGLLESRNGKVRRFAAHRLLLTGSQEYAEAFSKAMSGRHLTNGESELLARAQDEERAMTSGGTTAGGYAVPTPLDPSMFLTGAGSTNPFRRISRVIPTTEGNTWKGVSAAQVTASTDTEAAEVSDDSPTLAQPSISIYTNRVFVPLSFEAFEDIENIAGDIAGLMADAKDNLEATLMATGTGSSQPFGVVAAVAATAGSRVSPATGGTFAVADVYSVDTAIPARHEDSPDLAWVMNKKYVNAARQFATANNYHAFLVDLGAGRPSQLLGSPLYTASAMSSSTTTGQDILIHGNFSRYYIVDKIGASMEFIPNLFHTSNNLPSGQRAWLMHWRFGADSVDDDAFRVLRL